MISLLQTKTADTLHTGILQVTHFPDFWVGPGDEARLEVCTLPISLLLVR